MKAPDLTDPIIGYRAWRTDGEALGSCGVGGYVWFPGENVARCSYHDHPAPDHDCGCGLYAYHELKDVPESWGLIGAVVGEGQVEVHPDGFRCERATIIALTKPGDLTDGPRIAARYGVPVVPRNRLESFAQEHGSPVPKSLRPEAEADSDGMATVAGYSSALNRAWNSAALMSQRYEGGKNESPPPEPSGPTRPVFTPLTTAAVSCGSIAGAVLAATFLFT